MPDGSAEVVAREQGLRALAKSRLDSCDEVDEVIQEVALAVVSNRSAKPERWGEWLRRIVVTQVTLYRRKTGRRRKLVAIVAQLTSELEVATERSPLDWLIAEERRDEVREALGRLATADSEILLWKYRDDLRTEQIAQQLQITVSAAEARLHRARGRLRFQLLKENPSHGDELD